MVTCVIKILPVAGMALFPFILLKDARLKTHKVLINHEKIHLKQQLELLVLPFYVLYISFYIVNLIRYRNHNMAYREICFEREAFGNEQDFTYLKKRKALGWMNYISQ